MEAEEVLHTVALRVYNGDYGLFLKTFADAYLHADSENEKILYPAWRQLIEKYDLLRKVDGGLKL
ncbi:MAG: hypothetical protein KAT53_09210 [Dehalococcoidia bacterium]|nr:hypothetical protein [Dehalococcoidia bacterium]